MATELEEARRARQAPARIEAAEGRLAELEATLPALEAAGGRRHRAGRRRRGRRGVLAPAGPSWPRPTRQFEVRSAGLIERRRVLADAAPRWSGDWRAMPRSGRRRRPAVGAWRPTGWPSTD